jgi:hypothetical protein
MVEITEGMLVKATAQDGSEVHGYVIYNEDMEFFITGEKPTLLESCTNIRLTEDEPKGDVVTQILNADIKKIDPKKVKDPVKLGDAREKELVKMKVLKGDEGYKDKFAAGVVIAKAASGQGTGLFNKSCLDKFKKKESTDNMDNMESIKENDMEPNENIPLDGDTVIGEKPLDDTPADATEDVATETPAEEPVAPITDMTINNTMIDDAASVTTPQVGDDVLKSSDSITDYSQFLDNPAEVTNPISVTTPEEDNIIVDAVGSPSDPATVSYDDVQITVKNPSQTPIEIKIGGEKEEEINNEIDKELDDYNPEDGYSDEGFFEHLCKKYDYQYKLTEGESVSSAICKLISDVASR